MKMGVCKHERCTALARFEGFCPGHYATRRQRDRRSEVGTSNDREEPVCDECGRPASALKSFNRKRRMHDSCIKTRKRRAKEAAPEADGKRPLKKRAGADMINHPPHYNMGSIEVSEFIADQDLNFFAGNVIKYICRYRHKGTPTEDLKKALWYLRKEIERWESAGDDRQARQ